MLQIPRHLFIACALASGFSACGSKDKTAEQATQTITTAPAEATPAPAPNPAGPTAPAGPAATFDISTVPESTADLGPFPYLAGLPGYEVNTSNSSSFDFERAYIYDGKNIITVEGKVSRRLFQPIDRDKANSALMVQRNYEELFKQIGAVKVSDSMVPREAIEKIGSDNYYKYNGGIAGDNSPAYTYVLRQKGKEVWLQMEVSTDQYRLNVTERAAMAQQATLLKADELKKRLDAEGRVALYLNFDTDQARIKVESGPVVAEVRKLLQANPALRLAVQGHTDNTSTPAHNQQLSEARAQEVVRTLTAQGVAADRLQAAGFGQTKPLADNATEAGRTQNRRVELVKR